MSSESIASLLLGFVLGLYGGVVIARYSRFAELRNEVLRVIRSIDFIQEQNGVVITNVDDVPKLMLVVSDLLFLKHRKAADVVSAIRSDIDEISIHSKSRKAESQRL